MINYVFKALGVSFFLMGLMSYSPTVLSQTPLRIQLKPYQQGSELWVTMTLTNRSKAPVYLNKIDIGMSNRLLNRLFVIKQQQAEVRYTGVLAKRLAPTEADFILLKPAQSVQTKIRLDQSYAFRPGKHRYSIQYKHYHASPVDETILNEFSSATFPFTYTGRQALGETERVF